MDKTKFIVCCLLLMPVFFLASCATSPKFDTAGINTGLAPSQAVEENQILQGVQVLWGGVIISSTNLQDATQIEVLAYPLDSNQKPMNEQKPLGRFLAIQSGYLETTDYAAGRMVTVTGKLDGKRFGHVGEAEYIYPVIRINQLYLWSKRGDTDTQVQFGFGLMIHN